MVVVDLRDCTVSSPSRSALVSPPTSTNSSSSFMTSQEAADSDSELVSASTTTDVPLENGVTYRA